MLIDSICPGCSKNFGMPHWYKNRGRSFCSRACYLANYTKPTKHGHGRRDHKTKEFKAWADMIARCTNPNNTGYQRYGGRGISVCNQWRESFENFLTDMGTAPSPAHSLGRINNDGNYEPGNVEWQTVKQQANNKSSNRFITAFGETHTLQEWSNMLSLSQPMIKARIFRYGWDPEKALSTKPEFKFDGGERLLTLNGQTMNMSQWAKVTGLKRHTIKKRIDDLGWSVKDALTNYNSKYHRRH